MRKHLFSLACAGLAVVASGAAHAQYFNFSTSFNPVTILTTQSGNQVDITNSANSSGLFAGAFGTDIQLANFVVTASSALIGTFNAPITETITLAPSDMNGNVLAGDNPISHTFNFNYTGAISSSSTSTSLSGWPSATQLYTFLDGSTFTVQVNSYSGPGGQGSSGKGALGGHVNGALAGITQATPEPGQFAMLAGMGVVGIGMISRRRKYSVSK